MEKTMKITVMFSIVFLLGVSFGDTFTHTQSGKMVHGYATSEIVDSKTTVITPDGQIKINLAEYSLEYNNKGRNNTVAVLSIPGGISTQMETEAFLKALSEEADKGPLFILVEIDSPGGRIDYCKKLCSAITDMRNCQVVAYIHGGENGGALSAAAAVSLACDKIFISNDATIGAATMVLSSQQGVMDAEEVYGETVGEKYGSAWRNYLATIAESKNRSGILAKAMEDKDLEVFEIQDKGSRRFIESVNMRPEFRKIKTWSKTGELLTLTANSAIETKMADQIANSREEVLQLMDAPSAQIIIDKRTEEARKLYKRLEAKFQDIQNTINGNFVELTNTQSYRHALKATRQIITDLKLMMKLKKQFTDDIPYSEEWIKQSLIEWKAYYKTLKTM